VSVWDTHGVDIVVTGHSHNYMRSNPVNLTASMEEAQPSFDEGILYLSSGGWGAPLYETKEGWWVAYTDSLLHFTQIDLFANGTLHAQAKDVDGVTFDEVRVHKDLPDIGELMAERLASAQLRADAVEEEKALLEEQLETLGINYEDLEDELEAATSELVVLEREIHSLEAELAGLEDEIDFLEAELENYQTEMVEVVSAKEELEDSLVEMGSQLEELVDETGNLRAQLQEKSVQIYVVLGVAAVAVVAAVVFSLRKRSG
jgi:predicted nuclease with TOPRIM domain